ncbi:uncharacterized protein LOC132173616 [Corylus avellana]|uniref:uncharacterized protein LOC132173616 n=1 Tax=Corylus avellana TaxID=13451 RepID=UPI00286A9A21|nr:uncharacterized protein LOC132173616 [Corylus avellana]
MEEELETLCGKISLTEGEKVGLKICEGEIAEGRAKGARCLVGKIGGERRVNKEAFRTVLSRIWRLSGSVTFKEIQDNIWLFEFEELYDKRRVLEGRPWSFDRQILVLHDFDGSTPPSQMDFSHSPFWIQIHEMPLLCMTKAVASKIGASLGTVEDIDIAGDGVGWGRCLRIRVIINLRAPLERGRALQVEGKSYWVIFKYEKLPMMCFDCGRIMHGPKGCPVMVNHRRNSDGRLKEWGVWLRAEDNRRNSGGDRGGGATRPTDMGNDGGSTAKGWENKATRAKSGYPSRSSNSEEGSSSKCADSSYMEVEGLAGGGDVMLDSRRTDGDFSLYVGDLDVNTRMGPKNDLSVDEAAVTAKKGKPREVPKQVHVATDSNSSMQRASPTSGPNGKEVAEVTCHSPAILEDVVTHSAAMGKAESGPVTNVGMGGTQTNLRRWKRRARVPEEDRVSVSHSDANKRKTPTKGEGTAEVERLKRICKGVGAKQTVDLKMAETAKQLRQPK